MLRIKCQLSAQLQRRHLYQLHPQLQGSGRITGGGREVVRAIGCPQSAGKCCVFRALYHSTSELTCTSQVNTVCQHSNRQHQSDSELSNRKGGDTEGEGMCWEHRGEGKLLRCISWRCMVCMHGIFEESKIPLKISLSSTLRSCTRVRDPAELMNLVISSYKPIANQLVSTVRREYPRKDICQKRRCSRKKGILEIGRESATACSLVVPNCSVTRTICRQDAGLSSSVRWGYETEGVAWHVSG